MACAGHSKDSLDQAKALLAKGDRNGAQNLLVSAINNSSKSKEQLVLMKQLADLRANDPPSSQEKLLGQISTLSMELCGAKSLEYADACARVGKNKFVLRDFAGSASAWQTAGSIYKEKGGESERLEMEALSGQIASECASGKCSQKTELYEQLYALRKKVLGAYDIQTNTAESLLAEIYLRAHKNDKALELYKDLYKKSLSKSLNERASVCLSLARTYTQMKQFDTAEPLLKSTLEYAESHPFNGNVNPNLVAALKAYCNFYDEQKKYKDELLLAQRLLDVNEKQMGPRHPQLTGTLSLYADVLDKNGKSTESADVRKRIKSIEMSAEEWKPTPPRETSSAKQS